MTRSASPGLLCENRNGFGFDGFPGARRIHAETLREVPRLRLRHRIGHNVKRLSRQFRPAQHGDSRRFAGLHSTKVRQLVEGTMAVAATHDLLSAVYLPSPLALRWSADRWCPRLRLCIAQPPSFSLLDPVRLHGQLFRSQTGLNTRYEGHGVGNHQGALLRGQPSTVKAGDDRTVIGRALVTGQLLIATRTNDADSASLVPDDVHSFGNGSAATRCLAHELVGLVDACHKQELRNLHVSALVLARVRGTPAFAQTLVSPSTSYRPSVRSTCAFVAKS
jgi:hypothetical protein